MLYLDSEHDLIQFDFQVVDYSNRSQVEYYFSDLNLATTDHLIRFISKDPEGYGKMFVATKSYAFLLEAFALPCELVLHK